MAGEVINKNKRYTQEEREQACAQYLVTGNVRKVGEMMNIPFTSIQNWKKKDWWIELTEKLRAEKEDQMVAKLEHIIDRTQDAIIDRVENGDEIVDKDGKTVRKLMTGRDLATVMGISMDKRNITLSKPTTISANVDTGMAAMLEEFSKFARKNEEKVVSEQ